MINANTIPKSTNTEERLEWERLIDILRILRSKEGCPWDQVQTLASLRPHIIEEPTELLEAIGNLQDMPSEAAHAHVKEELGDVLLVITMMIIMYDADTANTHSSSSSTASTSNSATETGAFVEILTTLNNKLIRRHPHVFGEVKIDNAEQLASQWQKIKSEQEGKIKPKLADYKNYMHVLERTKEVQKRLSKDYGMLKESIAVKTAQLSKQVAELAELEKLLPEHNLETTKEEDKKSATYLPTPDKIEKAIGESLYALIDIARSFRVSPTAALSRILAIEIKNNSIPE